MPTDKPRFSITMDKGMLEKVDNFKESNNFSSQSKAIIALISIGMEELKEKGPPQSDGPPGYHDLSPENRALVDAMIAQLAKSQSGNQSASDSPAKARGTKQ